MNETPIGEFYNLPELFRLREAVAAADPAGPPALQMIRPATATAPARVGLLAGSFNPFHAAHQALIAVALAAARLDELVLVLSKRTVDKERVSGMSLEDRLLTLGLVAATQPGCSVALVNRGLYVDQAALFREARGRRIALSVIVGFDKIVQILDPRYYDDRDAALGRLFSLAEVLVAPRGSADEADLARLLAEPGNRRFASAVRALPMPAGLATVSSSQLRADVREASSPDAAGLPPLIRAFIRETGAYAEPVRLSDGEVVDAYALRGALIEALARARPWADTEGDLRRLVRLATGKGEASRALRAWLRDVPPGETTAALRAFQAQAG